MGLRQAFAWKTLQFVVIFVIELAGLAVLARLITPVEMGIYAAAFALLRFGQFIGNFGLYNVILRQDALDIDFRRHIVGLTGFASLCVTLLYIAALWIWDFGRPESILAMLLPVIPLAALSMPANALLVREMRFQMQFRLRLVGAILFPICAIPLAYFGTGPASLAIGTLVSSGVFAVLSVWATGRVFFVWPSLRVGLPMLKFASTLFFLHGIREAREATTTLLIGRLVGLGGLGQYNRATELQGKANQVLSETVMPVLVPHLFNNARRGTSELRFEVLRALEYITALAWPMAATLIILGPTVIAVVLGDQWALAGQIFSVMGFALAMQSVGGIMSTTAIALKQEKKILKIAILNLIVSLSVVISLASYDLIAMLFVLILVQWGIVALQYGIVAQQLSVVFKDLRDKLWRSAVVTAVVAVGLGLIMAMTQEFPTPWRLVLGLLGGAVMWLSAFRAVKHPMLGEIHALAAKILRPKRPAVPEA